MSLRGSDQDALYVEPLISFQSFDWQCGSLVFQRWRSQRPRLEFLRMVKKSLEKSLNSRSAESSCLPSSNEKSKY